MKALGVFDDIYTVSVRDNDGCEALFDALSRYAVEGPHYFDDDAYTDMPEKELVAEVIREKALLYMRDEIPHGIAVVVERFKERPGTDLLDMGRMETTVFRAKEIAPLAEKMITLGKKKDMAAYRQALAFITREDVAKKVFDEVAPKYADRNGGYTRITRIGTRRGDAAEMAVIELV